jgi:hypothetical protein
MAKWRHSPEAREKIRRKATGRPCSPETRRKIAKTMKDRWQIKFVRKDAAEASANA